MFQAMRTYTLLSGSTETFLQRVQESFVPLIRQLPGFIAYDARSVGTDLVRTTGTFQTRAGAESSVLLALRWVQEHSPELISKLPILHVDQVVSAAHMTVAPLAGPDHADKRLVLDLTFEVLHPAALGKSVPGDPQVRTMVADVQHMLTEMWADPDSRDQVIYRFDGAVCPEVATRGLWTADHVILVRRAGQLVSYLEINREVEAWRSHERFEGDILVDPAAYHHDAAGLVMEKGIGLQGLLEMRRQAHMLGVTDIELDVYRSNQPMHHFLDHVIASQLLPITKQPMEHGWPCDHTYHLAVA